MGSVGVVIGRGRSSTSGMKEVVLRGISHGAQLRLK